MPQFDESFLSDCADAERQNLLSYSLDRGKQYRRRKAKSAKYFLSCGPRTTPCVVITNVVRYSAISSPSTPNSSLSSQSNLIGATPSPNTPSPATPTQQPLTPLGTPAPNTPSGNSSSSSSGHKNSLKGTKLARRARSFKDDLIEKISLMRTPTNTLGRSHSPHSPRSKHAASKPPPTAEEVAKSSQSLDTHVKDISNALKHFRDVISRKKLEVLPGNGTVILETIASMFAVIQSYTLNENSTALLSATQQVYQSLGKLIKLCDEVMLSDGIDECAALSEENVKEVVDFLEEAVRNLVTLAQQKLKEKETSAYKYGGSVAGNADNVGGGGGGVSAAVSTISQHHLMRPSVEVAGQRTSLPDITLTPKERDILEKTNSNPIRASHSTESILRDTSPPPKPPLPNRSNNPPPLPPKRNFHSQQQPQHHHQQQQQQHNHNHNNSQNYISMNSDLDCSSEFSLMNYGVEHLSVRSRSPDENSSQCSLDSALNHSREDDEPKVLGLLENRLNDSMLEDAIDKMFVLNSFISMKSFRESTQSVSKRSSDYSFQSSTKSSSSEIASGIVESSSSEFHLAEQQTSVYAAVSAGGELEQRTKQTSSSKIFTSTLANELHHTAMGNNTNTSASASPEHANCERDGQSVFAKGNNSLFLADDVVTLRSVVEGWAPPALPPKNVRGKERLLSQYDNADSVDNVNNSFSAHDLPELRHYHHQHQQQHQHQHHHPPHHQFQHQQHNHQQHQQHQQQQQQQYQQQHHVFHQWQSKHQSLIEPRRLGGSIAGSCNALGMDCNSNSDDPPPLPVKKKHILAYMEICTASTRSIEQHRHTMHAYNRNIPHSQTMNIVPVTKDLTSPEHETPPALPPKNYKQRILTSVPPTIITTPPPSPKPAHAGSENCSGELAAGRHAHNHSRVLSGSQGGELMTTVCEELADLNDDDQLQLHHSHNLLNENEPDAALLAEEESSPKSPAQRLGNHQAPICTPDITNEEDEGIDVVLENHNYTKKNCSNANEGLPNLLEEIDITPYLIVKKESEDGPEVKGGYLDALIVHASRVQKISDNAFSEAFITTFRTFIQPIDVIEKLTHRYTLFFCQLNDQKQKAAKETFSLLVRVVNDLTATDLTRQLLTLLMEFDYQLVCSGQLYQVKLFRNKIIEKVNLYKDLKLPSYPAVFLHHTVTNQPSLLDLKSVEIAEQMTLLDAELFQKIEIPEVLLFAKEQCEEKSPNLNKFTEHFNKMSYWARSKILLLQDAKEREKHVVKFIKIMKHLRKMNNYNSYLALLSALDSAPIRRLEWHKTITESLKEYCTLIDSSSSFRVYRQALAETNPPCIPYIGLVLQDLTFVHVGNPDYLKEGIINFSKRWQQYNIIVNMKRFKKCAYPFRRNERIIRFFENFENFLGEEDMWHISETIKPRGKRLAVHN